MVAPTRDELLRRHAALVSERSSFLEHWSDLAEQMLPRRFRRSTSERNAAFAGRKRNDKVVNNVARIAARTLASGMHAGMTSPARPWFKLTTIDPDLSAFGAAKSWLSEVEERMRLVFARSNLYTALPTLYADLGVFGSAALAVFDDADAVINCVVWPAGSYCFANGANGRVATVHHEQSFTVEQLVETFGLENVSRRARAAWEAGRLYEWIETLHVVEPRLGADPTRADALSMPFRSVWIETRSGEAPTALLAESGFAEKPVLGVRWNCVGEDAYGESPGMDALGDARALQVLERRKAQAIDKLVNPPMVAPSTLRAERASLLPGDVTYVDAVQGGQAFRPAIEIPPEGVTVVGREIAEHERRVNAAFYADLFLMLTQLDTPQMTAREVVERHEEKMLQLGPVIERTEDELLDPLVDRVFGLMHRRGLLPEPPAEMQGKELRVEYVSVLAAAQRLIGTSGVERLAGFVGNIYGAKPEILDVIDFDKAVEDYASMLGVDPGIIVPADERRRIRDQRAQAEQAAQAAQAAPAVNQAAQAAKTLSETDVNGDNALARLLAARQGGAI